MGSIDVHGTKLEFSNVTRATTLRLHYASPMTGFIGVKVNGANQNIKIISTGDYGTYQTADYTVNIPPNATITFYYDYNLGTRFNLDYIELIY